MKTLNSMIVLFAFLVALGSCTTMVKFPVSPIAPAADGIAKIKKDKNNNYVIDLSINHLANPDRLNPPKKHYVVWISTDQDRPINLGMLVSNSKNKAFLRTVTSSKPIQVFVTAEDAGNVKWPGSQELFRSEKLNLK
jgi:hypothetical protein